MNSTRLIFLILLLHLLHLLQCPQAYGLTSQAVFNQRGIQGSITFSQQNSTSPTTIVVSLVGLELLPGETYPWHVHQYPFPLVSANPCRGELTGGHYDPLEANYGQDNYTTVCQSDPDLCEIGDLSGKFGRLDASNSNATYVDSDLSLYGIYSIVGRSIVVHRTDSSRYVCANIDYPMSSPTELLYSPFRRVFAGNVYFTQHSSPSTASVYVDLLRTDGASGTEGHNWHVHSNRVAPDDTMCQAIGPHYNPRGVDTAGNYSEVCRMTSQSSCEVGDLAGKSTPLNVASNSGVTKLLYTDTDLPLSGNSISIVNRSVAIHERNLSSPIIACASIESYRPLTAAAVFDEQGVTGKISFTQTSPFEETIVTVSLNGLGRMANGYHVHEFPVGPGESGSRRCSAVYAGGHWNPRGIVYGNGRAPVTSDEYEVGDLSGKFGGLLDENDISETYADPNIPLSGSESIIGRSIVIHYPNNSRWLCANIMYDVPTVQFSSSFNTGGFSGRITFIQPTDNPLADTVIIVEADLLSGGSISPVLSTVSPTSFQGLSPSVTSSTLTSFSVSPTLDLSLPVSSSQPLLSSSVIIQTSSISVSSALSSNLSASSSSSVIPDSSPFLSAPLTSASSSSTSSSLTPPATSSSSSPPLTSVSSSSTSSSFIPPATSTSSSPSLTPASTSSSFTPSAIQQPSVTPSLSLASVSESSVAALLPLTTSSNFDGDFSTMFFMSDMTVDIGSSNSQLPVTTTTMPLSASMSFLVSPTPSATPSGGGTRRRRSWIKRQTNVGIGWSLRSAPVVGTDCSSQPVLDPFGASSQSCSIGQPLVCSAGDLTGKHGMLSSGSIRAVFSDPNLPLSGSNAVFSTDSPAALLLEPDSSATGAGVCAVVMPVVAPLPSSSSSTVPSPTSTLPPAPGDNTTVIIGAVVGGVGGALLVVAAVVIILLCCLKCRRGRYDVSHTKKRAGVELGFIDPTIGESNFRAVFNYTPQNEDDLALTKGDTVTLLEAPKGGGWWRGRVDEREGWFPKSYIEYVDAEQEKRRRQEESYQMAAAAIVVASSSFSARHGSLTVKRGHTVETRAATLSHSGAVSRKTFSKHDIDSTPKLVKKLYQGDDDRSAEKEKEILMLENGAYATLDAAPTTDTSATGEEEATVIENSGRDSDSSSRPDTPKSIRAAEVISNPSALEGSQLSQESATTESPLLISMTAVATAAAVSTESTQRQERDVSTRGSDALPGSDLYVAKYDYSGTTDLELILKKGDHVNVIEKTDNGWWRGVCEGRTGWFPATYVRAAPTQERWVRGNVGTKEEGLFPRSMAEMMETGSAELEASEYQALFTYRAGAEGDLAFKEGDTVLVYWSHDNGWWYGAAGTELGWFPGSYLEPIIDVSSMPTSPTEEGKGAVVERRRSSRKVSRERGEGKEKSSKKWSFRVRRKAEEVVPHTEDPLSPLLPEDSTLQSEIATALLRKASSHLSPTEDKQFSIDERVAMIKKERNASDSAEQNKSELMMALTRRQQRSSAGGESPEPHELPGITEDEAEDSTLLVDEKRLLVDEKEPERAVSPDDDVFMAPEEEQKHSVATISTGAAAEPDLEAGITEERKSPDGQESTEFKVQETAETSAAMEGKAAVPLTKSSTHPSIESQQENKEKEPGADSSGSTQRVRHLSEHKNKPRRVAPPPPTSKPTSPVPADKQAGDEVKKKPLAAAREKSHLPQASAVKEKPSASAQGASQTLPTKASKRAEKKQKDTKKDTRQKGKADKRKFTLSAKPSKGVISTPVVPFSDEPSSVHKSFTLAGVQDRPLRPPQRRTTSTGIHKVKPRRPPPPPPASKMAKPASPTAVEHTDGHVVSAAPAPAPSMVATPLAALEVRRPVAPPRRRPRVQRVKRPVSRFIPPPPNIPLPPPPPRRRTSSQKPTTPDIPTNAQTSTDASIPPTTDTNSQSKSKAAKPPTLPKPAHLKRSTSDSSKCSSVAVSPIPDDGRPTTPGSDGSSKRPSKGAKPPPPVRTSSLNEVMSPLLTPQQSSPLPAIKDVSEDVDAAKSEKETVPGEEGSSLRGRSDPPTHTPPPRPITPVSEETASRGAAQSEGPDASGVNKENSEQETKLRPKGSSLVRSLKRIVQRSPSTKRGSTAANDEEAEQSQEVKSKPPRPSQPPKLPTTENGEATPTLSAVARGGESPVPKPRTKLQEQAPAEGATIVDPETQATIPEGDIDSHSKVPPARPPPPKVASDPPNSTAPGNRPVKEKPVPLPRSTTTTTADSEGDTPAVSNREDLHITLEIGVNKSTSSSTASSPTKQSSNFYRAIRSYKAERETELSFSANDILIEIDRPEGEREFCYGMLDDGNTGLFPVNCVEPFRSPKH